jgi:hypothetical protein
LGTVLSLFGYFRGQIFKKFKMKWMWTSGLIILICFFSSHLSAQSDEWREKPTIGIMGFADVFYIYDFDEPVTASRQPFFFNHNRHNEFNLNLGLIKLGLEHSKYRANIALQTGTYAVDNYAEEPGALRNMFEANVGVSLNRRNNLWLDAGIFPSHLGFESAISIENPTLTRSLAAENSPYFLSGAKLTYNPDEKLELAALIVNGWQRIQRVQGNSLPSFGTQVNYSPDDKVSLNWSTFIGTDDPDISRRMRYFNNLYGKFQLTENVGLTAGVDVGLQQQEKGSSALDTWYTPVVIAQYQITQNWNTAVRAEYYQDATGIVVQTGTANGFRTAAFSWNLDYLPSPNVACRLESRLLSSRDEVFDSGSSNFFMGASLAIKFEEMIGR